MAIVYCCWTTGDDTTGDGSYGTPYKTITKASTGLTGGDEVRVSKSPAHTALTGTLTWADNSTSVSTSADLTGELAAGDMIGKDADDDMWWEVTSLDATTITLRHVYSGTGEAVASYKMGFHDYGSPAAASTQIQAVSASGSSVSSLLKISGGWDLSTQTQTGWSFFCVTHSTNRYGYGLYSTGKSFLEVEKLSFARITDAININTGSGSKFSDIGGFSFGASPAFTFSSTLCHLLRLKMCGLAQNFQNFVSLSGANNMFDEILLASFTGLSSTAIASPGNGSVIKKVTVRCSATGVLLVNNAKYSSIIVERCITGVSFSNTAGDKNPKIGRLEINNCTTGMIFSGYTGRTEIGALITSGNTSEVSWSAGGQGGQQLPAYTVQRWQDVAEDSRMIFREGVAARDTADARSGACLKATPTSATVSMWISLGKHRVTSVAADIVLSVYAKDDATFNGTVDLMALMNGQIVSDFWVEKTMDTAYGQHTLTVDTLDLVNGEWLELVARVRGTAGSVFFDDFAAA